MPPPPSETIARIEDGHLYLRKMGTWYKQTCPLCVDSATHQNEWCGMYCPHIDLTETQVILHCWGTKRTFDLEEAE